MVFVTPGQGFSFLGPGLPVLCSQKKLCGRACRVHVPYNRAPMWNKLSRGHCTLESWVCAPSVPQRDSYFSVHHPPRRKSFFLPGLSLSMGL